MKYTKMNYPLNTDEVRCIIDKPTNVVRFRDIPKIDKVEDMFINNRCVLLYETSDNVGHWVGMYHDKHRNRINYFDPYGTFMDDQLNFIDDPFLSCSGQDEKHLLKLLVKYKGDVHYLNRPLQSMERGINTCGRWVGWYLNVANSDTLENIQEYVEKYMDCEYDSLDNFVTTVTNKKLKDGYSSGKLMGGHMNTGYSRFRSRNEKTF